MNSSAGWLGSWAKKLLTASVFRYAVVCLDISSFVTSYFDLKIGVKTQAFYFK